MIESQPVTQGEAPRRTYLGKVLKELLSRKQWVGDPHSPSPAFLFPVSLSTVPFPSSPSP